VVELSNNAVIGYKAQILRHSQNVDRREVALDQVTRVVIGSIVDKVSVEVRKGLRCKSIEAAL
jgi:hypothetical protein